MCAIYLSFDFPRMNDRPACRLMSLGRDRCFNSPGIRHSQLLINVSSHILLTSQSGIIINYGRRGRTRRKRSFRSLNRFFTVFFVDWLPSYFLLIFGRFCGPKYRITFELKFDQICRKNVWIHGNMSRQTLLPCCLKIRTLFEWLLIIIFHIAALSFRENIAFVLALTAIPRAPFSPTAQSFSFS